MAAFNLAGLLSDMHANFQGLPWERRWRCETSACLFKQCNEHKIILNVSESYQR